MFVAILVAVALGLTFVAGYLAGREVSRHEQLDQIHTALKMISDVLGTVDLRVARVTRRLDKELSDDRTFNEVEIPTDPKR